MMLIKSAIIGSMVAGYKIRQKNKKLIKSGLQRLQEKLPCSKTQDIKEREDRNIQWSVVTSGISGLGLVFPVFRLINLILLVALCTPVIDSAWKKIKNEKQVGHDFLVSILAIIGILSAQFVALSIALIFYYSGRKLLLKTQNHTKLLLTELFHKQSDTVWLIQDGVELQVELKQIHVGDQIIVHTGEVIPVDGRVVTGIIIVDQHQLTGESQPADKVAGDLVFASSQIMHGTATIKVEKTGADTTAAKITDILASTADHKLAMLSQGEIWADRVALPLLGLSAVMLPFLGIIGASAILNCTFGNRLQLTAPLSVLNHLKLATEKGIMIKDGRAIETLSQVDTVIFDKTGTLTTDQPYVSAMITCNQNYSEEQLLMEAAVAELKLSHPIAKAIVVKAQESGIELPEIDYESDVTFEIGLGVQALIGKRLIQVGSQRFIEAQGISIPEKVQQAAEAAYQQCHSIVFVAADSELKGILQIAPTIRPEIKANLQKLRQQGIQHLTVISGDRREPTRNIAESLGIDEFFAEVLPEQKADIIRELQKQGRTVCFIGDGINDTIAMKCADVSVSIDGSSRIACDLAQIIFMDGSLYHLNDLFALAFSLEKNMEDTVAMLYTPTLINLFGAFFLGFGLMTTVIINNVSLLLAYQRTKQDSLEKFSY